MALTALPCKAPRIARRAALCARLRGNVASRAVAVPLDFDTAAFKKDLVEFAGTQEYIVKGGRDKFENLPRAFNDIKEARSCAYVPLYLAVVARTRVHDLEVGQADTQVVVL
jgi:hypothetical protein